MVDSQCDRNRDVEVEDSHRDTSRDVEDSQCDVVEDSQRDVVVEESPPEKKPRL